MEIDPHVECDRASHEKFKRLIKTQSVLPSAETAAMLFWALLASGQITMRKVDGWQSRAEKPSDQIIDLTACGGNIVTREIAPNSIPTQIATPLCEISSSAIISLWA